MARHDVWLKTILSALLLSSAFIFCDVLGWCVLLAPIPLLCIPTLRFWQGVGWGGIVYGIHFYWLFVLLVESARVNSILAGMAYVGLVGYCALTAGAWFWLTGVLSAAGWWRRVSAFALTTTAYFVFIDRWLFFILKNNFGYPLLNPAIPLIHYKWFAHALVCATTLVSGGGGCTHYTVQNVVRNDTVAFRVHNAQGKTCCVVPLDARHIWQGAGLARRVGTWHAQAERVSIELARHDWGALSGESEELCVVAPESTYLAPLEEHASVIQSWYTLLPKQAHFLVSGVRGQRARAYQTVYHLHESLIIQNYDKTKLVPFTEKVPGRWKHFSWLSRHLGQSFYKGLKTNNGSLFALSPDFTLVPVLCYELFTRPASTFRSAPIICAFVNDSWFMGYMQIILIETARLKSTLSGTPIVYSAYSKSLSISPFSATL